MRRHAMLLSLVGVLLLTLSVPAVAKKGGKPAGPVFGLPCDEAYAQVPNILLGEHEFSGAEPGALRFELSKEQPEACYDIRSERMGVWVVEVSGDTAPREMNIMIRDSAPGDFCGPDGYQVRSGSEILDSTWTFTGVPASGLDVCGNGFQEGTRQKDEPLTFWLNARNLPRNQTLFVTVTITPTP